MFFTIKTLQQKTFKVELDDSENVLALKHKIEESQGETFPAASMKLIYAGKILNDATALSEYKIQENSFVVVMVSKPKPKPAEPSPSTPEQQETTTSGETSTPQTSTNEQEASQPQAQASITTSTSSSTTTTSSTPTPLLAAPQTPVAQTSSEPTGEGTESTDDREREEEHQEGFSEEASSTLVQGSEYEQAVSNLMTLGFPRQQVVLALNASYNNPDRAADYLYNGIPESVYEQQAQQAAAGPQQGSAPSQPSGEQQEQTQQETQPQQPSQQPAVEGEGGGQVEGDPLANLRALPQFQTLRQIIRNRPEMLPALLQQIGQNNPQLLQVISQNQQSFIDLLNESGGDGSSSAPARGVGANQPPQQPHPQPLVPGGPGGAGGPGGEGEEGAGGGGPLYGQPMSIQVSPQEKEAIDRLVAMGFPEHLVIQAYFACDKNEELTAEFLLQQDPIDD